MNILNKSVKSIIYILFLLVAIIVVALVFWHRDRPGVGIGDDLRLVQDRWDLVHILKETELIVAPTIVDYRNLSDYVVGLRLPIRFMACDNFGYARVQVLNIRKFFIVNKKTGELFDFSIQSDFEKKLNELNISQKINLEYSNFESVWNRYKKLYAQVNIDPDCENYPIDTLEYRMSEP